MPKRQSLASKVLAPSSAVIPVDFKGEPSEQEQFQRYSLRLDDKVANPVVERQAQPYADAQWGAEIDALTHELDDLEAEYRHSQSRLHELQLAVMTTPETVRRNTPASRAGQTTTAFAQWRRTDQLSFVVLLVAFFLALMVGVANPYVVLMNSGLPIFIDQWYLAFLLSLVVPLGSLLIKFYGNNFTYHRHKKRYVHLINATACALLLAWSIVFSQSFASLADDVLISLDGSSGGKNHLLTGLQLLCELFVAAGLALALESIQSKYDDDAWDTNLEFVRLDEALKRHRPAYTAICARRTAKNERLTQLTCQRDAFINGYVVEYAAKRRVDQTQRSL